MNTEKREKELIKEDKINKEYYESFEWFWDKQTDKKEKKMRIERKNGWIHISDIIGGYLETRKYMDYTENEAKRLFKEEFNIKGDE